MISRFLARPGDMYLFNAAHVHGVGPVRDMSAHRDAVEHAWIHRCDDGGLVDLTDEVDEAGGRLSALVADYYHSVDRRDLEAALSCFAPDAVYRRPGHEAA